MSGFLWADVSEVVADDDGDLTAFQKAAKQYVDEHTSSSQAALACLVALGTHLADGSLAKEYQC